MNIDEQIAKAKALQILREKECVMWPDCHCQSYLLLWQDNLRDQEGVWTLEELEQAEDMIFLSLECIGKRCPDKKLKRYAKAQLRDPYWSQQKRKGFRVVR